MCVKIDVYFYFRSNILCENETSPDKQYPREYSPFDDSDADPDYDPNLSDGTSGKRKCPPQFFKDSDFNFPKETIKNKIINYKDETGVFPSPDATCETIGLTNSERNIVLEKGFHVLVDNGTSDEQLLASCNKEDKTQESESKLMNSTGKKACRKNFREKVVFLPPCQSKCRKMCFQKITPEQRIYIFDYFKGLDYGERQLFFDKYLTKNDIKYRKADATRNKKFSLSYNLPIIPLDEPNADINVTTNNHNIIIKNIISVCKTMFIHTIGFKTDGSITNFVRRTANDLPCLGDKRGKQRGLQMKSISEANKKNVNEHIDSYHPQVSHYNIMHAPNRRYLPPDLTINQMYKDFALKYKHVSYETYRKIFESNNIGFTAPTQDDCGVCSLYKQHSHDKTLNLSNNSDNTEGDVAMEVQERENLPSTSVGQPVEENHPSISGTSADIPCLVCDNYNIHKRRYTVARQKYTEDTTKQWDNEWELYAVDMQKILILPKMTIKNSFFISRLVVFHETFANLKSGKQNKCVLWHEAVKGRTAQDVTSAFYNALIRLDAETKHVIFWADNCTAQNKNWTIFTACITFVNENWGPESITFKYFEPGHSFMKADSVHGQIGKKWNKTPEVLDFEDLEKLIKSSNKNNHVISLHAQDFKLFENGCMTRKKGTVVPKLNDIKTVQFRKGSRKLFYQLELEGDDFSEVNILNQKFKLSLPDSCSSSRGLNSTKKDNIVKQLLPHMPPRKQIFWNNLPSEENLEDLGKTVTQF